MSKDACKHQSFRDAVAKTTTQVVETCAKKSSGFKPHNVTILKQELRSRNLERRA